MNDTTLIAEQFAEAARDAQLTAEQQELLATRLNEVLSDSMSNDIYHNEYEFLSAANAR